VLRCPSACCRCSGRPARLPIEVPVPEIARVLDR
jgi:hypothetical protein